MIARSARERRPFAFDRPAFQWDALRGAGPLIVQLFGRLGPRELAEIADAIRDRGRSPRDLVCLDFEQVTHVDYRALPDFAEALVRQENRGAAVCLTGLSEYVRHLFDVSGQGPALHRFEWLPVKEAVNERRPALRGALHKPSTGRGELWR
jgi:anti-anti-sigma regulatory factor